MLCSEAINKIGSGIGRILDQNMVDPLSRGYGYATSNAADRSIMGMFDQMFGADASNMLSYTFGGKKNAAGVMEGQHTWNMGKVAGTVGGAALGYRFLSGGGVYRDKNGNTDIAGVPFV